MEVAVSVKNLSKKYRLYVDKWGPLKELVLKKKLHNEFYALKNISLDFPKGEAIGVLGRNGSGKSTLLKIITGITEPTNGSLSIDGSLVFLDVSSGIDPELTGYENIFLKGILLGYSKEEMLKKVDDIIEFSELEEFIYQPVKNYSSGMKSKLGFAISVNVNPDILIVDEALAVGDALFRKKCMEKMNEFKKQGKTIIFVSHDKNAIESFCTKAAWIEKGTLVTYGDSKYVSSLYNDFMSQKKTIESIQSEINFLHSIEEVSYKMVDNGLSMIIKGYLYERSKKQYDFDLVIKNERTGERIIKPIKREFYSEDFPLNIDIKTGFSLELSEKDNPYFFSPGSYSILASYKEGNKTIEFPLWSGKVNIQTEEDEHSGRFLYHFKKENQNLKLIIENKDKIQQQVNDISYMDNSIHMEGVAFVRGYETKSDKDVSMFLHLVNDKTFKRYVYPLLITETEEITENPKFNPQGKIYNFSKFLANIDIHEIPIGTYECQLEYKMEKAPYYELIDLVWASKTENYPKETYTIGNITVKIKNQNKNLQIEVKQ